MAIPTTAELVRQHERRIEARIRELNAGHNADSGLTEKLEHDRAVFHRSAEVLESVERESGAGEERPPPPHPAGLYLHLSLKDAIVLWASEHDGEVDIRSMSKKLADWGLWRTQRAAYRALFVELDTMDEAGKARRRFEGAYRVPTKVRRSPPP